MSLAFIDGAEHRLITPTPPLFDPSSGTPGSGGILYSNSSPVTARYGTGYFYSIADGNVIRWKVPTPDPEIWSGFAFYQSLGFGGTAGPMWACFGNGATIQHVGFYLNANGSISAYRGTSAGTLLGTSTTGVLSIGVWAYVEVHALIDDSAGEIDIKVDGVSVLSLTAQDTKNGGSSANLDVVGGSRIANGTFCLYDDIYTVTGDGSGVSGFQDEISIQGISPNAAGNYTQLTPVGSATNYQNVDEVPFSATDYNGSPTPGQKDTYGYANLTATTGDILGSVLYTGYRKNNAGFIKGRRVIRISTTDYNGADYPSFSGTMQVKAEVLEVSPATSTAWTISEVNAMEAGFEVRSA